VHPQGHILPLWPPQDTTIRFKINRSYIAETELCPERVQREKNNICMGIQKLCERAKQNFVINSGDFNVGGENKTRLVIVGAFGKNKLL
jgi:hypothetical protein